MQRGDTSIYTDTAGGEHVAVVTETHDDGSVDLARLPTSHRRVPRSAVKATGTFFDPSWIDEAPPQPAFDAVAPGLASVPLDGLMTYAGEPTLLQGSSSPAGLWPPGNLDPVPGEGDDATKNVENPAHGAPADVTPDEPQAG